MQTQIDIQSLYMYIQGIEHASYNIQVGQQPSSAYSS